MRNRMERIELIAYTRHAVPRIYPDGLARSVHFAWRRGGGAFTPLHQGYGILFAEAGIDENNVLLPRGIAEPTLGPDGDAYFIAAVRMREDGNPDEASAGGFLLWRTRDFLSFDAPQWIPLRTEAILHKVWVFRREDRYGVIWREEGGRTMKASADSLSGLSAAWPEPVLGAEINDFQIPDAETFGNPIEISEDRLRALLHRWDRLQNTEIRVPAHVTVQTPQQLADVKATAVYSDGSTDEKRVDWALSAVDFTKPGVYPVSGTVRAPRLGFPLARGYADPVVFPWEGKYYFISTNDNTDARGLFIREADTVEALFREDAPMYQILGWDPVRSLIQTFWAPEIHVIGGSVYILFAVSGREWGPQCHMMRLKKDARPILAASWEDPVRVMKPDGSYLAEEAITLDMTCLKTPGASYLVWSYREHIGSPLDSGSMLYIARCDDASPWRLASEPVLLSRPLYGWENLEGTINNEGPYAFRYNGKVYLAYSAAAANSYSYCVGLLCADETGDLCDPAVWQKSPTAAMSFASVGEFGPGHNSFYYDEDGKLMTVYHAVEGIDRHVRCTGIRRVHFDAVGRPRFDLPASQDPDPLLSRVKTLVHIEK